jgi:hypothetical protein
VFHLFLFNCIQSKIKVKDSEWRLRKDSSPSTGGFLELCSQGLEVTLPISDGDFQKLVAIKLSQEIPLYF